MTLWAEWPIDEALKQICSPVFSPPAQDNRCNIPAHLWPGGVAVLDEGLDADLDFCLDGGLGVLDEAVLLVVLVALLLLLRGVGRRVRGVASTVVGMVAQHLKDKGVVFEEREEKYLPLRHTRSPPPPPPCLCNACRRRQRWQSRRQHRCHLAGWLSTATLCLLS